jgi:aldoxime dehydratase
MVYLGVQFKEGAARADAAIANLKSGIAAHAGPETWDTARFVDDLGYTNVVLVGYWSSQRIYESWNKALPEGWWHYSLAADGDVGAVREAYTPSVVDTETTFSHPRPEGYSRLADRMSGKTDTHEYWGSARDRIPRAQTDALVPTGRPESGTLRPGEDTLGGKVVVAPHDNLCLLRSGQDWSETEGTERTFYLERVKPLLDKGMAEICNDGRRLGCYFNRYVTIQDDDGPVEKSYSLSAWHSLGDLESWVKADTHLAIWGAGIKHFKLAGDEAAKLRLYHEMMVLKAEDQSFSYFNCHRRTGMLCAIAN